MEDQQQTTALAPHQGDGAPAVPQRRQKMQAIVPQSYGELERFAETVAYSNLVPKNFRKKPQDVMVAVMHGMEIGLQPLQALQNIAVINGKPSIYGDAAIALVRSSPVCEYVREELERGDDASDEEAFRGVCYAKRTGEEEQVRTFSVADAKRAGLWGRKGPWSDYPQRMLQMRARSWALRDVFADVLAGLYIYEEARDIPTDESEKRRERRQEEPEQIAEAEVVEEGGDRTERRLESVRKRLRRADDFDAVADKIWAHAQDEWGWSKPQMARLDEVFTEMEMELKEGFYTEPEKEETLFVEEDSPGDAAVAFEAALQEFEIDMEAAAEEHDAPEDKRAAVQAVAKAFSDDYQDAPEAQRVRISEVYSSVLNGISEEGNTQAADDMMEGKTAL